MADEVEISNVGGDQGVASEATLKSLTKAIEKLAASTGKDPRKEAGKVQEQYNNAVRSGIRVSTQNRDAIKDKTEAVNAATKATRSFTNSLNNAALNSISAVGRSLLGFSQELLGGAEDISSFASHIPLIGSYVGILTGLIDENINSFRELSTAGAIFGDGLNDIRHTAAMAGMPLSEFTSLVMQNSEQMKYFGATTAEGARNFAKFAGDFRRGPGQQFIALGYTSQELNESLIEYAEFTNAQLGIQRRDNALTQQSATQYLETVNQLAAVTGKRRDQIKAEMNAAMADQRARLAMATMSKEEQATFSANLAAAPASLQEALKDAADGVLNNPLSQGLSVASETFRKEADKIKNMNAREFNNFMANVGRELDEAGEQLGAGAQAVIQSGTGYGDAIAMAAELREKGLMSEKAFNDLLEKNLQEAANNDGLKQFADTIREIRSSLMSVLTTKGEGGTSPLSMVQSALSSVAEKIREFVESPAFTTGITNISNVITDFIDTWQQFDLKTALFGNAEKGIEGAFKDLFSPDGPLAGIGTAISDSLKSAIKGAAPEIGLAIAGAVVALFASKKLLDMVGSGITKAFEGLFSSPAGPSTSGRSTSRRPPTSRPPASTRGGAAGANIGGFLGQMGAGVMQGAARGLMAFANPAVPIGAAALGAAIVTIGAGIAGAAWLTGKALPTFSEGLQSFETLDGERLKAAGIGMAAIAAGMAAFGAGSVVGGLGNLVGDIYAGIGELFGADDPLTKIQKFSEYDIDAAGVEANAKAFLAFGQAMSAAGSGSAMTGIGALVSGITEGLLSLFGGKSPLEKIKEFGEMRINAEGVTANANALLTFNNALRQLNSDELKNIEIPDNIIRSLRNVSRLSGEDLSAAARGMQAIADVSGMQANLEVLSTGLDTRSVTNYNRAVADLVNTLEKLNEVLAEDNKGVFGGGSGVAAKDVVSQINTSNAGSSEGSAQLNRVMQEMVDILREMAEDIEQTQRNTRNIGGGNIANGYISAIR